MTFYDKYKKVQLYNKEGEALMPRTTDYSVYLDETTTLKETLPTLAKLTDIKVSSQEPGEPGDIDLSTEYLRTGDVSVTNVDATAVNIAVKQSNATVQKKLIPGEGIIIDEETNTISATAKPIEGEYLSKNNPFGTGRIALNVSAEDFPTLGENSISLGNNSKATGTTSVAIGFGTTASGVESFAIGEHTTASGVISYAEGLSTTASGSQSHAEGKQTLAAGQQSHAEGCLTNAAKNHSHAEGHHTTADGLAAHAEGYYSKAQNDYAHAEGYQTTASGANSHSEGKESQATAASAHAEGQNTEASGGFSHAEGCYTKAQSYGAHAEGQYCEAKADFAAHAEGYYSKAKGAYGSHAEGNYTEATGKASHAEGDHTIASAEHTHAEGMNTKAIKNGAHAEGYNTICNGYNGHVEGEGTEVVGDYGSHAEGYYNGSYGSASHSEGYNTNSDGFASHSEGHLTFAKGHSAHAENGWYNQCLDSSATITAKNGNVLTITTSLNWSYIMTMHSAIRNNGINPLYTAIISNFSKKDSTITVIASNIDRIKVGDSISIYNHGITAALGDCTHAEGYSSIANNNYSHAEGYFTITNGDYSHAEGFNTNTSAAGAHAEGYYSAGKGEYSHAEGCYASSTGKYSHAEGKNSTSFGECSHAEGDYAWANGYASHAEGASTTASKNLTFNLKLSFPGADETECPNLGPYFAEDTTISQMYIEFEDKNFDPFFKINYFTPNSSFGGTSFYDKDTGLATSGGGFVITEELALNVSEKALVNITPITIKGNSYIPKQYTIFTTGSGYGTGDRGGSFGQYSHTEGVMTVADGHCQHVQGRFNIADINSALIVGNGECIATNRGTTFTRSNAHTMDWSGNAWYAGDIYVGSTSGTNKDEGSVKVATEKDLDERIVSLTQEEYNALSVKNPKTLYLIVEE